MNIVSFYAPRPDHPFFQDYRPYLDLLRASCERFGHRHIVLTDDARAVGGDDAYEVPLPHALMKAVTQAQFAYLSDPAFANEPTLLVGADCVLARDPAEMFGGLDTDLAITVSDAFLDCRMNTGVIYIPKPCQVAEIWAEALAHVGDDWGDDQTSLYRAIQERPWHGVWTARVTELPVDPYNLAPEYPGDDCTRAAVLHFRGPRKQWMADYCKNWLDIGEGVTLTLAPNMPEEGMLTNVRVNVARGLEQVRQRPAHAGHAVLVGGGPSLESTLPEIMRRQAGGQTIFALNGAGDWLAARGVFADYRVILDPRPENVRFVGDCRTGPYLLASQCSPVVVEAALDRGHPVQLWHYASEGIQGIVPDALLICGGITVGLTAMALAFAMGYRLLHLYGYDSSDSEAQASHAYSQAETKAEAHKVEVWCGRQRFTAGAAMYAQAKAFPEWAELLAAEGATITVHGDGLLPTVARHMNASIPYQEDIAA